jgi:excisionase family DNA binding protein
MIEKTTDDFGANEHRARVRMRIGSNSFQDMEWLDLRGVTSYAAVSERTVRDWIHLPSNPLPAVQVGNKLLVKRTVLDEWLAVHAVQPSQAVEAIVRDVIRKIR